MKPGKMPQEGAPDAGALWGSEQDAQLEATPHLLSPTLQSLSHGGGGRASEAATQRVQVSCKADEDSGGHPTLRVYEDR